MNRNRKITLLVLGAALSGCASAGPHWDDYEYTDDTASAFHAGDTGFEDRARVISVRPIRETVRVRVPGRRCREEVRHHSRLEDSYTPPLIGAIVGGVVGNQFGEGSGKTAMTVAGTLLGASVARDLARDARRRGHGPHAHHRRCETHDHWTSRQEIVGYHVRYRYKGRVFRTRMDHDPGDFIRVRVDVRPVD